MHHCIETGRACRALIYILVFLINAFWAIGQTDQNPPIEKLSDSVYRIGTVRLDREKREIYLSGRVNMNRGIVEVVACGPQGKLHESIFVLDVVPHDVQVALLLLGLDESRVQLSDDGKHLLHGDTVTIFARWQIGQEQVSYAAEDLIATADNQDRVSLQSWIFVGSRIIDGVFQADVQQSIISTFYELDAQNCIIGGAFAREHDFSDFVANEKILPPRKTPVEIVIQVPVK